MLAGSLHPNPDNEPVELQTALGRLVMCWAPLEALLDCTCIVVFNKFDAGILTRSLPRNFERKLQYLRDCLAGIPTLGPLEASTTPLLDAIAVVAKHRNWLTHGFNLQTDVAENPASFSFMKMVYGAKKHDLDSHGYTAQEIHGYATNCLLLGGLMASLGQGLLQLSQNDP